MVYKVNLTARAEADLYAAFERIREASPLHAERWLTGLFKMVFSLSEMPARSVMECGLENRFKADGTHEVRNQLYCLAPEKIIVVEETIAEK